MSPFQIIDASTDPFMVFTSVLYALLTLIIFLKKPNYFRKSDFTEPVN